MYFSKLPITFISASVPSSVSIFFQRHLRDSSLFLENTCIHIKAYAFASIVIRLCFMWFDVNYLHQHTSNSFIIQIIWIQPEGISSSSFLLYYLYFIVHTVPKPKTLEQTRKKHTHTYK